MNEAPFKIGDQVEPKSAFSRIIPYFRRGDSDVVLNPREVVSLTVSHVQLWPPDESGEGRLNQTWIIRFEEVHGASSHYDANAFVAVSEARIKTKDYELRERFTCAKYLGIDPDKISSVEQQEHLGMLKVTCFINVGGGADGIRRFIDLAFPKQEKEPTSV